MKYGVNRQILLITAGTVWIIAGANILRIGIVTWINTSQDWMFKIGEATVVFLLFFVLVFRRLYYKHTRRIEQKKETPQLSVLFLRCEKLDNHDIHDFSGNHDPKLPFATRNFYLCFYTGLSIALILTGMLFIRYWWIRRKTFAS